MTANTPKPHNAAAAAPFAAAQRLLAVFQSDDFRQAVQVALAMVIAYYFSLSMGWDRPHWAGLAIAVCSFATAGDSLNKGLLRILGTFLAGFVALLFISLFPQDRWTYLVGATAYIAFCTYMMGHTSRWYFWFIAGYVMPLLAMAGGPVGATAFETVVLRIQQTTMGVVVYTLVSVLLWPRHSTPVLTQTVSNLADVQRRLLGLYIAVLTGAGTDGEAAKLRAQATGAVARLPAVVDGAELDSFEVWETRHLWRRCVNAFAALNATMERWRLGFPELEKVDLERLLPGLAAFGAELDARLADVARMLAGKPPARRPGEVTLELDEKILNTTPRFDRAALMRSHSLLQRIDRQTRALFDIIADIRGFIPKARDVSPAPVSAPPWTIDLDRLACAARAFAGVWFILLACIYLPDFPMPAGVIPLAAAVAIMLALMPEAPIRLLFLPLLGVDLLAGAFHILVMPHLAGFGELGLGIFVAVFLIGLLLGKPMQGMVRSLGLSMFVMIIFVHNQQPYDFLYVANFTLMSQLALAAIWVSTFFPISFRPQRVIFKQLRRYVRSCERLASPLQGDSSRGFRRMGLTFHLHEVNTLPGKIGRWMAALPAAAQGWKTPEQAHALVDNLRALSERMSEWVEARQAPQSAALVEGLSADTHTWRAGIREVIRRLAADPASAEAELLHARLDAKLEALEARIEKALNDAPAGSVSPEEFNNMYVLLGAYRGVSEALINVARSVGGIDWERVREARF